MTLGYDEPVAMPVVDLFDNAMMQQYIAAAREQYKEAEDSRKEFYKSYGDFYSPSAVDTENYYNATVGGANKMIADAQANGIDLFRSPEGRAMISQFIASRPYTELAKYKQSAENLKTYNKMVAQAKANGTYNEDFERFQLNGMNPSNWSTADNGVWQTLSPAKYQDLYGSTNKWFDGMKASDLGLDPTGRYRISGVNQAAMDKIANGNLTNFVKSDLGKFYMKQVKDELRAEGNENPNTTDTLNRLKQNILSINSKVLNSKYDTDPYAMQDVRFKDEKEMQDVRFKDEKEMENIRHGHNVNLENLRTNNNIKEFKAKTDYEDDLDGDGKVSKEERLAGRTGRRKGSKKKITHSIFDDAAADGTRYVEYRPSKAYENGINSKNTSAPRDKNGNYTGSGDQFTLYRRDIIDSKNKVAIASIKLEKDKTYTFVPNGKLKARKLSDGVTRYYIQGNVVYNTGVIDKKTKKPIWEPLKNPEGGRGIYMMEVEPGANDYEIKK